MTEKEKCLSGQLYNPNKDEGLQQEMMACKDLCHQYNLLSPLADKERDALITRILGGRKEHVMILSPFYFDYGSNITIGENFFSNHGLVILDGAPVTFGDNVFIGPNCCFSTAGHPLDASVRNEGLEFARPITIGNSVWIGANVTVLPGVTIGDKAVIGAGSVVAKDIPPGVVAVGVPCNVVKTIEK